MKQRAVLRAFLAITIIIGFFVALYWLLTNDVKDSQVALILVGALGANFGAIVQFYFGSSAGSEHKTDLMSGGERAQS